jgi:hypothetical protein
VKTIICIVQGEHANIYHYDGEQIRPVADVAIFGEITPTTVAHLAEALFNLSEQPQPEPKRTVKKVKRDTRRFPITIGDVTKIIERNPDTGITANEIADVLWKDNEGRGHTPEWVRTAVRNRITLGTSDTEPANWRVGDRHFTDHGRARRFYPLAPYTDQPLPGMS